MDFVDVFLHVLHAFCVFVAVGDRAGVAGPPAESVSFETWDAGVGGGGGGGVVEKGWVDGDIVLWVYVVSC